MALDTIAVQLEAAVVEAQNASAIMRQVANGDATTEVGTESGPVPSIARWFATLDERTEGALDDLTERVTAVEGVAQGASTTASAALPKAGGKMTGALNLADPVSIASAATLNIRGAASNTLFVTGTATITSLGAASGTSVGTERTLIFTAGITLTHGPNLLLPGGVNAVTAAGDVYNFVEAGPGVWRCTGFMLASGAALSSGLPVGSTVPWALPEASLPAGHIPYNGHILSRAMWPDLWALYAPYVVTDAFWIANPLSRGKPSSGDGSTTFRMPDMNGKYSDGLTPAAFLRGYGLNSAGTPGLMQRDQLGPMMYVDSAFNSLTTVYISNAAAPAATAIMPRVGATQVPPVAAAPDGTKWVTNTGPETRPFSSTVIWCCIGGTTAVNPGTVDITATAAQVTAQASQIQNLQEASSLGVGQIWQNLVASRALGTSYTNSTGRTIFVHVNYQIAVGAARAALTIGSEVLEGTTIGSGGITSHISGPVPPGASYRVDNVGGGTPSVLSWKELR